MRSSFYCNNHRWQFNKCFCNFCKRLDHNIETCYQHNKSTISISVAAVDNTESICYHLVHDALKLFSVFSKDQLADIFTKSHPKGCLRDVVDNLKLVSHPLWIWGGLLTYIVLWALGPTRLLVQYIFLYYTFIYTAHIYLLYKNIHIYIYIYSII